MRRVVVKIIGALTSLGKNLDEYWEDYGLSFYSYICILQTHI